MNQRQTHTHIVTHVMSDPGSPLPVLSYKKPSKASKPQSSPASSSTQTDSLAVPNPHRVVLSRRKALQDFYKLHESNPADSEATDGQKEDNEKVLPELPLNAESNLETPLEPGVDEISLRAKQLNDPEELNKFIKLLDAGQILKVRNHIINGLNQHDLEKKSMVYDNYSELIKLSDVLAALNDSKSDKGPVFPVGLESKPRVTAKYIDATLAELNDMLAFDGPVFNQEFHRVIETIVASSDDADSLASVQGIAGE